MGNYIANDPSRLLQRTPQSPNCVQLRELTSLLCSEGIMTDHYRKMFNKDSSLFYKGIYRIVNDGYV